MFGEGSRKADISEAAVRETDRSPWWVLLLVWLVPCLYLPTLATRFDFIDDGNLVYPEPPMSFGERLQRVWTKIEANYQHLGPFRPALWVHWELQAEICAGSEVGWRVSRLAWTALAAWALFWFLRELRISPSAALFGTALAMWNPYRGEVWTSLTLAEGVAMPYALLGLVCAIRAARSPRPIVWDLGGAACVLAALGCKNTFAAVVPAQVFLRIAASGLTFGAAWRCHGRSACLLALTLLLPVGHYLFFKLNWHPGQYETGLFSWSQLLRLTSALKGALSLDYLAPGLLLVVVAVGGRMQKLHREYSLVCVTGLLLLLFGIGIYLPLDAVSGRYTMPAVWGADLCLGVLLSGLVAGTATFWRRIAGVALVGGLACVAIANVGKQEKFAARSELLWQALEYVEAKSGSGAGLAWQAGPDLNAEEGIHFHWHLAARGQRAVSVVIFDSSGKPLGRPELPPPSTAPSWLICGQASEPLPGAWQLDREFAVAYWCGRHAYKCHLFTEKPRGKPEDQEAGEQMTRR